MSSNGTRTRRSARRGLQIAEYIGVENHNQQAALEFIDGIYGRFDAYAHQPNMGEPRDDLMAGLRSFPFKRSYIVIYRPLSDGIYVLRVFHGARDYVRLFRAE